MPKIPAVKMPELPKNPFTKSNSSATPTPTPTSTPSPSKTSLSVGGKVITEKKVVALTPTPDSVLSDGIPKFYNPTTSRAEFRATAKGQNATPFDIRLNPMPVSDNRRVNANGTFRNMDPYTEDLFWARPGWSSDEARVGVRVALKQVLGNANLFESDMKELAYSISCVTQTANMKEFIRALGLSKAYRTRYFESSSNTRFIECNFINFLGRAPYSKDEISEHIKIINEQGYNAEINSYVDSDEYDSLYGESRIPAPNFCGGHPYNKGMNNTSILRGSSSSARDIKKKAVISVTAESVTSPLSIKKYLPDAWRGENTAREMAGPVYEFSPDEFWNPQPIGLREAEVKWLGRMGVWNKFWYKDSIVYKDVMKPKLKHSDAEEEEAAATLKYGSLMAKSYMGARFIFDMAPIIEIVPPAEGDKYGGRVSVQMQDISFGIPSDLQQGV